MYGCGDGGYGDDDDGDDPVLAQARVRWCVCSWRHVRTVHFCDRMRPMLSTFLLGALCVSPAAKAQARSQPKRRPAKVHRNVGVAVDRKLEVGERIFSFLRSFSSVEEADAYAAAVLQDDVPGSEQHRRAARLPYGFWDAFYRTEMNMMNNSSRRVAGTRALSRFLHARRTGATTRCAMRGIVRRGACRPHNENAMRAPGLCQMLLDFFVDEIQWLRCRADCSLLMNHARDLRQYLVQHGWPKEKLPKLVGKAGNMWLMRWRRRHGIRYKTAGMKLKVSWRKVLKRVRVLMGNIFRLRAFWDLVHPGKQMRWVSVDQKPSWFNNAGHTGTYAKKGSQPTVRENFHATRERYTILTVVPSWREDENVPPKVAVLFKGTPNGRIIRGIREHVEIPPWLMLQVQEKGSYRSEDVVEALEWILPEATCSEDSIILILDWFSGHRTEEVEAVSYTHPCGSQALA